MKITIIISVYKNVKALELILNSILNQSHKVNEIIVSEDGNSKIMREFISTINIPNLIHLTQEDLGWRKNIALNNSIKRASGDYLIFIDGDVVPHKRFIEGHISCAEKNKVCCGKRAELGQKYSSMVYNRSISIDKISKNYIFYIIPLHKDKIHHYEDGIYSPLLNKITSTRYVRHIIGCNFSCFKKDIEKINGFNEDFKNPSEGEDVDITWRFRGLGIEMKSCRYHLWHKKGFDNTDAEINRKIMHRNMNQNQFICLNGLKKLTTGKS
jgi:GT2 family glycosyltransferase